MECFIGQLALVGFTYAPQGWALCNGQMLPISQYQALFALLGTTYGGDGVNTFALPDLQGRVPIHAGAGLGLSVYQAGQKGGEENVTLTMNEMPAHNHQIAAHNGTAQPNQSGPSGNVLAGPTKFPGYSSDTANVTLASTAVTPQGGSQPHSNVQPFLVLNWIICLNGIWPSRQ